jgi:hypothetical protein
MFSAKVTKKLTLRSRRARFENDICMVNPPGKGEKDLYAAGTLPTTSLLDL